MWEYRLPKYDTDWIKPQGYTSYDEEAPEPLDAKLAAEDYFNHHDGWEIANDQPWDIEVRINGKVKAYTVHIESEPVFRAVEKK